MCVAGVCGNRFLKRVMSSSLKSQVIGVFFSYFWHSQFLRNGHFVEYMNMHAMLMQLTVVVGAD